MEFPELGTQCTMEDCQQLDFLPIKCSYCIKTFCKTHSLPFDHGCTEYDNINTSISNKNSDEIRAHTCSLPTCCMKELVPILCPHCELHFCLQHRHQTDHQCPKYEKPKEIMPETSKLVGEIVAKNQDKKPIRQGVKSEKLAAKVQLMKLKQNSKGLKQLPITERAYFLIKLPLEKKDEAVFVSNIWSIGKCIDNIASLCQIPNHNNNSAKPQLNLYTSSDNCVSSKKDVSVKSLIDNEVLFNGQSLWLKYVEFKQ